MSIIIKGTPTNSANEVVVLDASGKLPAVDGSQLTGGVAKTNAAQSFSAAQRGAVSSLTDGATITPDFSVGNNFSVTLGGNRTLANPTNLTAGQHGSIAITQDATGSRTLAYGTYTRTDSGIRQIGVSAQSLQPVATEAVLEGEHLSVAYGNVALAACVELAKEVVAPRKRIEELEVR